MWTFVIFLEVLRGIQYGTSGSSGDLLESSRFQGRAREQGDIIFFSILTPLDGFGFPMDFEGVHKVNFLRENQHKMIKVRFKKGFRKTLFYWCLMPKWEAWNGKKRFSHYTCCNLRGAGGHDNWGKMEVQMASTNYQNPSLGSPSSHFLIFCEVLMRFAFWWVFGSGKSLPKIANVSDFGRQFDSGCYIWEGMTKEAGSQGGERGGVMENSWLRYQDFIFGWVFKIIGWVFKVCFNTPLHRGRRIHGPPHLPPTSDFK